MYKHVMLLYTKSKDKKMLLVSHIIKQQNSYLDSTHKTLYCYYKCE